MLAPEIDVVDLATSLRFYVGVPEFRVQFERPAERFAYLERPGAELMRAVAAGAEIVLPMEDRWYHVDVGQPGGRWERVGPTEAGNRQFVVADPDGYLWRPFQDLGARHTPS